MTIVYIVTTLFYEFKYMHKVSVQFTNTIRRFNWGPNQIIVLLIINDHAPLSIESRKSSTTQLVRVLYLQPNGWRFDPAMGNLGLFTSTELPWLCCLYIVDSFSGLLGKSCLMPLILRLAIYLVGLGLVWRNWDHLSIYQKKKKLLVIVFMAWTNQLYIDNLIRLVDLIVVNCLLG